MRQGLRKDDRGIALISVMICATLCLLLSATILRVSLLSYRQKAIGKQTASTFYENEIYVDDIKMGLQSKVAAALTETTTTSRSQFVVKFKEKLLADGGTSLDPKVKLETALTSYLTGYNPSAPTKVKDITVKVDGFVDSNGDTQFFDESVPGEIVIKNVRISYTDLERGGYISEIKTDIRIRSPYVSQSTPSSGGYSMFAGSGLTIPADAAKPSMLTIEGDVYVGYDPGTEKKSGGTLVSAVAMSWSKWNTVYWPEGTKITINGDVCISGHSNLVILSKDVDIRGKIYVSSDSNVIIDENAVVKCQDIVVKATISSSTSGTVTTGTIYTPGYWHDKWNQRPDAPELPSTEGMEDWEKATVDPSYGRFEWVSETTEDIKVPKTVWSLSGTSVSSTGFSSGTANTENYLPTYGESLDADTVYNHSGNTSGLYVWNGSKATHINNNAALSKFNNLTLDANNKVHPCIETTVDQSTFYFDEVYLGLVDVDYFLKYALFDRNKFEASKQLSTSQYTTEDEKFKANVTSLDSLSSGGGRWQNYDYGNGTASVEVMLGNVQTMNRSDRGDGQLQCHFAIGYQDVTLMNDQNTGAQSIGIYITPNKISCTAREGTSTIKSLTNLASSTQKAQTFFDGLGREVMGVNTDKVPIDYQIVNNFFKDGIQVFYSDESNSTGGGGQQVTSAEKTLNASLEVISFENWEKNPATAATTS